MAVGFEVAVVVVLEGGGAAVVAVAVGFGDDSLPAPEEVDLARADSNVDLGPGQPVARAEPEEEVLQLTPRPLARLREPDRQSEHLCLADSTA